MLRDPNITPSATSTGEKDGDSAEAAEEEGDGGSEATPLQTAPATLATDIERSNSDSPDLFS